MDDRQQQINKEIEKREKERKYLQQEIEKEKEKIKEKREKRKIKLEQELQKEQQREIETNKELEELRTLKTEFEKDIKEIETTIRDNVRKKREIKRVRRAFLRARKGFIFQKDIIVDELQEYVLYLMRNNGNTEIIEGVEPGEFITQTKNSGEEKSMMLTANKLTNFTYGKYGHKGWIIHEDDMSPYPQEPLHNAEVFRKTTQKLAINYRDVNETKFMEAKTKQFVTYAIIGVIVLYVLYIILKNAGVLDPKETVQTVTTGIDIVTNNITVGTKVG